jgi:hypothetical protein
MGKIIRIPVLGLAVAVNGITPVIKRDRHGSATRSVSVTGRSAFDSNLSVVVRDKDGKERKVTEYFGKDKSWVQRNFYKLLYRNKTVLDLGSGLTTNIAAQAHANEAVTLAAPSGAPIHVLFLANNHATGTGATAAAATDYKLQTADAVTPQAGAKTFVSAANSQKYQTVATLSGYGTEAVTEWGLFTSATLSTTTGTPWTAGSATTGTVTGTPLTASSTTVQGQQQNIAIDTNSATPHYGIVISNTTSVVTVPAWYKLSDGTAAGTNPLNTETLNFRPIMYDHKVFSAINTVSGDTIQFTYQLTVASGN